MPGMKVDLSEVSCNTVNYIKDGADTYCLTDITDVLGFFFLKGQKQKFLDFQRASLIKNESESR
jgi:purine nucleoside permease